MSINILNFKKIFIYSSINQSRWLLLLIFLKNLIWLIYFITYNFIIIFIIYIINYSKINFNLKINNIINFSILNLFIFLNIASLPPFIFIFIKWYNIFLFINTINFNILFFFLIINTLIITFIYLNIINISMFKTFYSHKFILINLSFNSYKIIIIFMSFLILRNIIIID